MDFFNLDIFEVEKEDFTSYFYRLPKNEIVKTTPQENLIIWKDILTGQEVCGEEKIQIMGSNCTRYFIFNFLEEERLGEYKTIQKIVLSEEDYQKFLNALVNKEKSS